MKFDELKWAIGLILSVLAVVSAIQHGHRRGWI
jgi:hypothetical protein